MSSLRTEAWGFPFRITSTTRSTVTIMTVNRILLLMFSYSILFSKSPLSLQEVWRGQTIWPRSHSQQAAELGFEGNGAASGRGEKGLRRGPTQTAPRPQPPAPSSLPHQHSGPRSSWPHAGVQSTTCKFTDNFRLHLLCPSSPKLQIPDLTAHSASPLGFSNSQGSSCSS